MIKDSCEIVRGKFYFLATDSHLSSEKDVIIFNVNDLFKYEGFFNDFGPLNISCIFKFCQQLNRRIRLHSSSSKKIVHVTSNHSKKKVNSAFLNGCYQINFLSRTPLDAFKSLSQKNYKYINFRDASTGRCTFNLTLLMCLRAFDKALSSKLYVYRVFDAKQYDLYDKMEHGDIHWIVPKKILAFTGPRSVPLKQQGYQYHRPELYVSVFHRWRVSDVVRLNEAEYDCTVFEHAGIQHHDLIFQDGGVPSQRLVLRFLSLVEAARGAVAVHCKAGLGRTGTLIGCYLMKHKNLSAGESIAWLRLCRPGSVLGFQQNWLVDQQRRYLVYQLPRLSRTVSCQPTITRVPLQPISEQDEAPIVPHGDMLNFAKSQQKRSGTKNSVSDGTEESITDVILDYDVMPSSGWRQHAYNWHPRATSAQLDEFLPGQKLFSSTMNG